MAVTGGPRKVSYSTSTGTPVGTGPQKRTTSYDAPAYIPQTGASLDEEIAQANEVLRSPDASPEVKQQALERLNTLRDNPNTNKPQQAIPQKEPASSITAGRFDNYRASLRQQFPDVSPAFIDSLVDGWNRNNGGPIDQHAANDLVQGKWNQLNDTEKDGWHAKLTNNSADPINKADYYPLSEAAIKNGATSESGGAPGAGPDDYVDDALTQTKLNSAIQAGDYSTTVRPDIDKYKQDINAGVDVRAQEAGRLNTSGQNLQKVNTQAGIDSTANANKYNALNQGLVQNLGNAANTANSRQDAALSQYMNETNPLMTAVKGPDWGQDVQSKASDLANQQRALDMAGGVAGGSLDYRSQAAQAYANAGDVATQNRALDMLMNQALAGGATQQEAVDYARKEIQSGGKNQEEAVNFARQDVLNGGKNQQEALDRARDQLINGGDRQRQVYDQYQALTDPTITAKERQVFEQAQGAQEARDQSQRQANDQAMAMRGLRSGAMSVGSNLANTQQQAQTRAAGTLGIQAQAVDRAMQALAGAGTTANSLRQGDQAALSQFGTSANDLRSGNQNAINNFGTQSTNLRNSNQSAIDIFGNQATNMRNSDITAQSNAYSAAADTRKQGFNETYARGQAADAASANNQSTRLAGTGMYANQSNAMRTANDAMAQFNKSGAMQAGQFQAQLASTENTRIGNLAGARNAAGVQAASDAFGRATTVTNTGIGVNDTSAGRTQAAIEYGRSGQEANYGIDKDISTNNIGVADARTDASGKILDTDAKRVADEAAIREAAVDRTQKLLDAKRAAKVENSVIGS